MTNLDDIISQVSSWNYYDYFFEWKWKRDPKWTWSSGPISEIEKAFSGPNFVVGWVTKASGSYFHGRRKEIILKKKSLMWLLGFEPRSPRPQRGILTTKLQPQLYFLTSQNKLINETAGRARDSRDATDSFCNPKSKGCL